MKKVQLDSAAPVAVDEKPEKVDPVEGGGCCRGYHHGDLKNCLVEAALDVIVEKGVAGASLREIARRAGVSPRAPYHHFADKLSLLAEVARSGYQKLDALMANAMKVQDPEERLLELGLRYLEFAKVNPAEFQVMHLDELCENGETAFPDREEIATGSFSYLLDTLASVAGREMSEDELRVHGLLAWSMVHGLAQLRADGVLATKTRAGAGRCSPTVSAQGEESEERLLRQLLETNVGMQARELRRS